MSAPEDWGTLDHRLLHLDEDVLPGTLSRERVGYLNHGRSLARNAAGVWLVAYVTDLHQIDRTFLCLSLGPAGAESGSEFRDPILLAGASTGSRKTIFEMPVGPVGNAALWVDGRQILHVIFDHADGLFRASVPFTGAEPEATLRQRSNWIGPTRIAPAGARLCDLLPAHEGHADLFFTLDGSLHVSQLGADAAATAKKVCDDAMHGVTHRDQNGCTHLVFERDRRLYYLRQTTSNSPWQNSLDQSEPELVAHFCSSWPSIATTIDGRVVIAYQGEGKVDLRRVQNYPALRKDGGSTVSYAVHDGARWINRDLLRSSEIILFRRPTSSLTGDQQMLPFMEEFWRPSLCVDRHGTIWMFFINTTRRHIYWSRFEGETFGTHHEARGAYDLLSRVMLLQKDATQSDAIGMATFAAGQWYFDKIPVPTYHSDEPRRVVMLDGLEVEKSVGLERKIGQWKKHPDPIFGAFITGDEPEDMAAWCEVTRVKDGFAMQYLSMGGALFNTHMPGRAWSADGLKWEKRQPVFDNDMTLDGAPFPNAFWRPIFMEDKNEQDPSRRFKGVQYAYRYFRALELRWFRPVVSADGKHWKTMRDLPPVVCGDISLNIHLIRDDQESNPQRRYKLLMLAGAQTGRAVALFTSPDLLHWQSPKRMRQNPEILHSALSPYPTGPLPLDPDGSESAWEEEIHDSLLWREHGLLMFHYDAFYFAGNQHTNKALAVSRDGRHFTRVLRGAIDLPHGDCGAWDSGRVRSSLPIRVGDELWMYYCGMPASCFSDPDLDDPTRLEIKHQGQDASLANRLRRPWRVGRATLRVDGWAYVQMSRDAAKGELLTIPFEYRGGKLEVNGSDLGRGLRVEWVDQAGHVVSGFPAENSRFDADDAVTSHVTWANAPADGPRPGTYRLRFHFHSLAARLYAFGFSKQGGL